MPPSPVPIAEPSKTGSARSTWPMDLLVVGAIALLWFCAFFGTRPLTNPDEGRYAEIPREMVLSGDFITPRMNGLKYFEKPPLLYWLSALTFKVGGVNEFTARIWNGLFAVLGVLLVYWAARTLYGRAAGIWSSIVLGTCLLYYALGQILTLDMAVAVTMSGALFAFILAVDLPAGKRRFRLLMACYVFMALATLTKGLIGFVLPGGVIFLWTLLLNRWKSLFPAYLIVGIALFLAIAAPWHILAARANHDFLWFYFVHEHFLRFTTTIHGRYEPWWYLLPCVIGGLFPWIFFSWQALSSALKGGWKTRQENSVAWFLVIWIVFIVAFFSKSQSKLIPYVLPVFPAAAVLLGSCLGRIWEQRSALTIRKTAIGFGGVAVALTIGLLFYKAPKSHPEFAGHLTTLKVVLASGFVASIAVIFTGVRKRAARTMLTGVATTGVTLLIGANLIGSIYDSGSTKSLAMVMKPRLNAGDQVYCLMLYPQDLPLYLERMVKVVDYKGELEFGINAEPEISSRYFLSQAQFMAEWKNPGTHYAILRKWEYAKWFPEDGPSKIAEKGRYLLVTNHPADKAP